MIARMIGYGIMIALAITIFPIVYTNLNEAQGYNDTWAYNQTIAQGYNSLDTIHELNEPNSTSTTNYADYYGKVYNNQDK